MAPRGRVVRPTSDRVRQAALNMVTSRLSLEGATVADLFAGTGALGIEALSRGAAKVVFVDHDRLAIATIEANLAATGLGSDGWGPGVAGKGEGEGSPSDADEVTITLAQEDALDWARRGVGVDVVFCDPPYEFDAWPELLRSLHAGFAVLESDHAIEPGPRWEVLNVRRHGGTVVTLARSLPRSAKGPS